MTGLGPAYADAIHIRCPYEPCGAEPNLPCVNPHKDEPLLKAPHWQRLKAAEGGAAIEQDRAEDTVIRAEERSE